MSRDIETVFDNEKLQWAVVIVASVIIIGGSVYGIIKLLPQI